MGSSAVRRTPPRVVASFALVLVCALAVWWLFVRTSQPWDLRVFLKAGRDVLHGRTPYVPVDSPRVYAGDSFVYPYPVAWAFTPLSPLSQVWATAVFFTLSVGAVALACRLLGARGPWPVVAALAFEPSARSFQVGAINSWLLLGLAVVWTYRHRFLPLVAAATTVIVAKLFLLPLLGWLVLTRRLRAAAAVALASVGAVVAGCWISGLAPSAYQRMLSTLSLKEAPQSWSLTKVVRALGGSPGAAQAVCLVLAAAVLAVGYAWWRRTGEESAMFVAAVAASLVACPIVWSHYFVLLLIIPLVRGWRVRSMLALSIGSWLVIQVPEGGPTTVHVLRRIHALVHATWPVLLAFGIALLAVRTWRLIRPTLRGQRRVGAAAR